MTVFHCWGIRCCEDIGHMVFNLIGAGIFGKTEEDSIEDFKSVYEFERGVRQALRPQKRVALAKLPPSLPAPKLS